jgi:hypothetical protein
MTLELGRARVRTLAAAVAVAALVGCGGSNEAATENAKPAATEAAATKAQPAAVPDALVGTWTRRIVNPTATWTPAGVFTMKLLRDGTVEMYEADGNPKKECITQPYCATWGLTARDGKLTVGATVFCKDPGEYSYEVTRNRLTTTRVKDACGQDRAEFFAGATWRRQS